MNCCRVLEDLVLLQKNRKILLADDHALFRSGMNYVLDQLDGDVETFECANFADAITLAKETPDLDLALVDLSMPGLDNFGGLRQLRREMGDIPIVIVSALDRIPEIRTAMECGVSGYIPKTLESSVVIAALKLVFSGGVYLPPHLLQETFARQNTGTGESDNKPAHLTPRQQDVLALVARGYSNKNIADELVLAEGTVKLHVTALLKVLEVSNRTQAVVKANALGLTSRVIPENPKVF